MIRYLLLVLCCCIWETAIGQLFINELCASNDLTIEDEFGDSSDWIELYNAGNTAINLANYYLSDNPNELQKWPFPDWTLPPQQYLLVFASDRDVTNIYAHTNFKLSAGGESVILSSADGEIIDQLTYAALATDQSFGRRLDGQTALALFTVPSPGWSNNNAEGTGFTATPSWSRAAGQLGDDNTVNIGRIPENATVYFTRDGSLPTTDSERYIEAISIDTTTTLRAVAIAPGELPSTAITATYFTPESQHALPIIAITGEPYDLWSWERGILVDGGPNASTEWPYYGANYWTEEAIPVHVEFFNSDGNLEIAWPAETKPHGGRGARPNPMKPLRISMKKQYGVRSVTYPFFPDRERTTYQRLVLRNASGDYNNAHFRDAFLARYFIKSGLNLDVLAHRPVVVYVNGAYYGMENMREKSDQYYLQNNYGVDIDNLDLLEEDTMVVLGDFSRFDSMLEYVTTHDMANEAYYAQAQQFFDVENIAEGFIVQTAVNNGDWLHNNIKFWRERNRSDARWRYIIFDMDIAMGRHSWADYDEDSFGKRLASLPEDNKHSNLFLALLDNEGFRNNFLNRYADLLNTIFRTENWHRELDSTIAEIDPEMPRYFKKWTWPGYTVWQEERLPILYEYARQRAPYARQHLMDYFGLTNDVQLSLSTYPAEAGTIHINTITPEELPWDGYYFNGVPINLRIEAKPGYTFSHWGSTHTITAPNQQEQIRYNFAQDDAIVAYFAEAPEEISLSVSVASANWLSAQIALPKPQMVSWQLYDVQGRLLRHYAPQLLDGGEQTKNIELPNQLAAGAYLLQASTEQGIISSSFGVVR